VPHQVTDVGAEGVGDFGDLDEVEPALAALILRSDSNAMGTLRLLAKTQMADHLIDAFWKSDFVDRQIREALVRLFGLEPDPALVRLIRVKAPALGPAEIRASLGWLRTTFDFPVVASPTVERPAPEPAARPVRVPPNPSPKVDRTMTGQATSWRHATLGHRVRRLDLRLPLEGKRRGPEFSRRTVPGSRHPADERLDVLAVPGIRWQSRQGVVMDTEMTHPIAAAPLQ